MDSSNEFYKFNIEMARNYNIEQQRLDSFKPWFSNEVDKTKLARAGFFYLEERDHVKCVFCEVEIGGWMRGDNPFIEHKTHSPDCPFLWGDPVNNHPIPETQHLLLEDLEFLRQWTNTSKTINIPNKLRTHSAETIALTARYPSYADKTERLKSFANWPTSLKQTPEEMSDAGFFYLGIGDEVKCFYCGGCLRNFVSNDHALHEHKRYYFNRCKYIQLMYRSLKSSTYKLENRRPIKATCEQIQHLIDFMDQNDGMRTGSLLQDRVAYAKTWKELTSTLNDLGGATKDIKGWKEVWRNYKYNQKRKAKFDTGTASTSFSLPLHYSERPQVEIYEPSMESMEVEPNDESNLTSIDEFDLEKFTNMEASNEGLQPIRFTLVPNEKKDQKSNKSDILSNEIQQIDLKIEQLYLEIETLKLEKETKTRQKELIQKQEDLQNKSRNLEKR